MAKKITSPHDRFIRSLMSRPEVIEEFFQKNLPPDIKEHIDLTSIEPQQDSFVSDRLRTQMADMLYKVKIDGEVGYLYTLVEHQSKPEKLMPFRILKYMIAIQEAHLKKHKTETLPFVYPLLLYTGEKPYSYSMDLFDLFVDQKSLAQKTWQKSYDLIDLTQMSDEDLEPYLYYGTMCMVAKHIRDPDVSEVLSRLLGALQNIDVQGKDWYAEIVITYLAEAGEIPDEETFIDLARQIESVDEEKVMTLAQKWEQQGFDKGVEQGVQQGIEQSVQQIALNMLLKGAELEETSSFTELSLATLKTLKKALH